MSLFLHVERREPMSFGDEVQDALDKYIEEQNSPVAEIQGELRNFQLPAYIGDVGHNLAARERYECEVGKITWVGTGVRVNCPEGFWYLITARSSLHKKDIVVPMGVIDAGYQGELFVAVYPLPKSAQSFRLDKGINVVIIEKGEQIAQVIFLPAVRPSFVPVETFTPSPRGTNGFGSTTKKND